MRYLGGKFRIAKKLCEFLESQRNNDQLYAEPFVGGCSIFRFMNSPKVACDNDIDLTMFYKALQEGWIPPRVLSEEKYQLLKNEISSSALRAFALFFCSYGGKWKGGYARDPKSDRDFVLEAYKDSIRLLQQIKKSNICNAKEYDSFINSFPDNTLIYCDPPYSGTTKYKSAFDHNRFWEVMRKKSHYHQIFISEYNAPNDFKEVWSIQRKVNLNTKFVKQSRMEKVFQWIN